MLMWGLAILRSSQHLCICIMCRWRVIPLFNYSILLTGLCWHIQKFCWWWCLVFFVCLPHLCCFCLVGFCCWLHLVGGTCDIDVWVCLAILWWWFLHCMVCQILFHIWILHNLRPLFIMSDAWWLCGRVHVFCGVGFGAFLMFSSWIILVAWWSCFLVECRLCFLVLDRQVKWNLLLNLLV